MEETALATTDRSIESAAPLDLLRIAVSQNADIEKVEKLMALYERYQANEARKAFVVAMNAFKKSPPDIIRNRPSEHGKYAGLDTVCKAVMSALSEQGISHRWEYEQTGPDWIAVTCILTHEGGHAERTKMGGPPDLTGPKGNATKNAIQALASTRTYLERYTLLGAVGLESAYDDDGAGAGSEITPDNGDLAEQIEWLQNAKDLAELQKLYKQAYKTFEGNTNALRALITAKDHRKKELQ